MAPPCIIEVALNGTTTKAANPHVPRTPAEIAADTLACVAAGATIVHNHNDEPMWVADGVHAAAPYLEAWRPVRARHPDVLLYATQASGGRGIAIEARWAHHVELARAGVGPMGLVDPGSVSLGPLDAHGLPELDRVYVNTHADARYMVERCAELGLVPSISIFDPSFLRVALAFHAAGALPPGAVVKLYFGGALPFGLPPTEASLDAYLAMLDGSGLEWLVAVLGGDVAGCGLAARALERGGHVRVGLEDYAGARTPRNAELVEEVARLARGRPARGDGGRDPCAAALTAPAGVVAQVRVADAAHAAGGNRRRRPVVSEGVPLAPDVRRDAAEPRARAGGFPAGAGWIPAAVGSVRRRRPLTTLPRSHATWRSTPAAPPTSPPRSPSASPGR